MRVARLAKWLYITARQTATCRLWGTVDPWRRQATGLFCGLFCAGLVLVPGVTQSSRAETNTASTRGFSDSTIAPSDASTNLASASLPKSSTLPFSSEAELLEQLGHDFAPIQELFLNIAVAQVCGLRTKQVEAEYLARRAQIAQTEALDFDTLKALRYLSYVQLERRLRAVEPARLRPWCKEQQSDLKEFFQPQL